MMGVLIIFPRSTSVLQDRDLAAITFGEKTSQPLPELTAHFEHPGHSEIFPWPSKDLDGGASPAGAKLGERESEPPGSVSRRRSRPPPLPPPRGYPRLFRIPSISLRALLPGINTPSPALRSLPGSARNNNGILPPDAFKTIQASLPPRHFSLPPTLQKTRAQI